LEYEKFLARKDRLVAPHGAEAAVPAGTHGRFRNIVITGADGTPKDEFRPGEPWGVELEFAADDPARPLQIHLAVSTRDNVVCFSADSRLDGSGPFVGQSAYRVRVGVDALPLGKGEFVVYAYLADEKSLALFDARSDRTFHVESDVWRSGLMSLRAAWTSLPARGDPPR
ncbi:MAG: Wzt carbohydrate-binding domain-containing protein, partial [Thermoanaerobaculia bacterium]|nr:Wzt carbohydrate-binding domain-containing protein [Thermoanaerobaculia bacterium]